MTNTSEVLNRAADLIEERGWYSVGSDYRTTPWQPDPWGRPGTTDAFCLEGGIAAAAGIAVRSGSGNPDLRSCPAYRAVEAYLEIHMLSVWNDAPCRTASEVIEVLRACAVIEASRERQPAEVSSCPTR